MIHINNFKRSALREICFKSPTPSQSRARHPIISIIKRPEGRKRFFAAVLKDVNRDAVVFCTLLAYTGARLTELRELAVDRVHPDTNEIVLRSIKKRQYDKKGKLKQPQYRTIPLPELVMGSLVIALDIRAKQKRKQNVLLWPSVDSPNTPVDPTTVYRWVRGHLR